MRSPGDVTLARLPNRENSFLRWCRHSTRSERSDAVGAAFRSRVTYHARRVEPGEVRMRTTNRFRLVGPLLMTFAFCLAACSPTPLAGPPAGSGSSQAGQAGSTPIKIGYMADAN